MNDLSDKTKHTKSPDAEKIRNTENSRFRIYRRILAQRGEKCILKKTT